MSGAICHPGLQPGLPQRRSDHDPEVRPVGVWSRRLTQEHRIVYLVSEERIDFLQARYHY